MSEYEALEYLCRNYFHEDWAIESEGDPWRVVLDFTRSDRRLVGQLRGEVDRILASGLSEAEMRHLVLYELDCDYMAERDGWTYRGWLAEVADRVDRYLQLEGSVTCPVCGWTHLTEKPRRPSGLGSREVCPSCGFEFGVTDDGQGYTYEQWRQRWIDRGMPWEHHNRRTPPEGWDPREQLSRLLGDDG